MSTDLDTAPKFPTETFEAIIDQVYSLEEKDSNVAKLLRVFSLVSKSWLPRSRHHLFRRLTICGDEWTTTKRFLDLLDSPLCSIKPYVRILELVERTTMWLMDALPRLSVLLLSVQELWITGGMFNTPRYAAKVLSDFVNLEILVLDDCIFDSSPQLFETLSMCTSLQRIGIIGFCISPHSDSSSAVVNCPPPTSLRSIRIRSTYSNSIGSSDMMEWLMSGEQVPAIETLGLSIRLGESRAIAHCLRRLGPCLKNLEMRFDGRNLDAFLRDVDLRYNTNLISIRFSFSTIASLLAQVASSEVREVVVDVGLAYDDYDPLFENEYRVNNVDWDTVARVLDQPNFSNLERLLIPNVRYDMDGVRQSMLQRLPPGRARDKLVLCEQMFRNDP